MTFLPVRTEPDGRILYLCDRCGTPALTKNPPEQIYCLCKTSESVRLASAGWPSAEPEQLALLSGWYAAWFAQHASGEDRAAYPAGEARLAKCLRECQHFTPARCAKAGRGCEKRRVWFGWLLAGDCPRFEARSALD